MYYPHVCRRFCIHRRYFIHSLSYPSKYSRNTIISSNLLSKNSSYCSHHSNHFSFQISSYFLACEMLFQPFIFWNFSFRFFTRPPPYSSPQFLSLFHTTSSNFLSVRAHKRMHVCMYTSGKRVRIESNSFQSFFRKRNIFFPPMSFYSPYYVPHLLFLPSVLFLSRSLSFVPTSTFARTVLSLLYKDTFSPSLSLFHPFFRSFSLVVWLYRTVPKFLYFHNKKKAILFSYSSKLTTNHISFFLSAFRSSLRSHSFSALVFILCWINLSCLWFSLVLCSIRLTWTPYILHVQLFRKQFSLSTFLFFSFFFSLDAYENFLFKTSFPVLYSTLYSFQSYT